MQQDQRKKGLKEGDFFTEYGEANRYKILEVIGKGSYGVVCAAIDTHTGEKVAIKKINDIFEHISDALRILREIKLLRLLRHPDIVEIKCIMLPPSRREFKDIYVVFELMESDLHQVIKANDDLTLDHHRFFLYQMLRALKFMHTANVYHRDLKPKNILANANCKLKICDFGLARVAFNDAPTTTCWTDYVATRWYRAPELCGSFFAKYTPAIDIWSIGCIFAELLTGKPLFPGKSVVHQLDLMTDLLGTPSADTINGVRNEKARKYLIGMRKKQPVAFTEKFQNADPLALKLLQRLLGFDPKDRPTAEEALRDPYFKGLAKVEREPCCHPISKLEFEFERRRLTKDDIRELIFKEILEYHPQMLKDYMAGNDGPNFLYPSAVGQFRKQFAYLEENNGKNGPVIPPERKHVSLPRSTVNLSANMAPLTYSNNRQGSEEMYNVGIRVNDTTIPENIIRPSRPPPRVPAAKPGRVVGPVVPYTNDHPAETRIFIYNGGVNPSSQPIVNKEKPRSEVNNNIKMMMMPVVKEKEQLQPRTTSYGLVSKPAVVLHTNNIGMNKDPYYHQQQASKVSLLNDQIALNARLLHEQSQFSASAVAVTAAHHREFGLS
ncbi:mitogen-activated protein kinase 15-like [Impatiens glandulifera]|uniref:mitogen-activated protein kinase 15-like n=1 Tax=Impatiens glandulifera TaxID=253017 RepID=UPI001FB071A4|nr:mitogen-activated protein kinase 15-like [Impatiens glandulifera]